MIEDLCRDLIVNNDHIHVVEQRLRASINQGLGRETHEAATIKCYPTYLQEKKLEDFWHWISVALISVFFSLILVKT